MSQHNQYNLAHSVLIILFVPYKRYKVVYMADPLKAEYHDTVHFSYYRYTVGHLISEVTEVECILSGHQIKTQNS